MRPICWTPWLLQNLTWTLLGSEVWNVFVVWLCLDSSDPIKHESLPTSCAQWLVSWPTLLARQLSRWHLKTPFCVVLSWVCHWLIMALCNPVFCLYLQCQQIILHMYHILFPQHGLSVLNCFCQFWTTFYTMPNLTRTYYIFYQRLDMPTRLAVNFLHWLTARVMSLWLVPMCHLSLVHSITRCTACTRTHTSTFTQLSHLRACGLFCSANVNSFC